MRAQFELRPLDVTATDVYPEAAIKCSSTAIDMLNVLHGEAEDARNARKYNSCLPSTTVMTVFSQYCLALPSILVMSLSGVATLKGKMSVFQWY
jgi:hypothetical protein